MDGVFERLSAHFIKGMMIHDKLASYYDFLGLRGYKRCHEYEFYKDTMTYRRIQRYYINHHGRLIPELEIDDPGIIPDNWMRYKREEVDTSTKRKAVETGMKTWLDWEKTTKAALQEAIKELYDNGNVADAVFVKKILMDVNCELKKAERKALDLASVNYDMIHIVEEQKCIHDKYKAMMEDLL